MKHTSFAYGWISLKPGLALVVALLLLACIGGLSTAAAQPPRPGDTGKPTPVTTAVPGDATQQDEQSAVDAPAQGSAEGSGAKGDAVTQGLSVYSYAYRHNWGYRNGSLKLTLLDGRITARSRIFVSASELGANGSRLVGAAKYTVHNVAPRNGAVTIWLTIEWGSPLRTVVDYLVIQP